MTDREILNALLNRLEMRSQQWRDSAKEHRDAEREERRIVISGAHRAAAQLADGLANGIDADIEWVMSLMSVDAVNPSASSTGKLTTREKGI